MADDAGALLVRSGLVPANAMDDARTRVEAVGGTIGEQLVASGVIADDALTDFYRSRLLVPQVNPNTLARLPAKVVGAIPSDMAVELRAIPVSLDADNNLTVAMSDPSDSHAVDEIAFFTGTYVVRAVATQMQIAWCLAHYYGHVTALGERLLQPAGTASDPALPIAVPRVKGLTAKVAASRHRAIAPITGPVDVARPTSSQLDDATPPMGSTPAAPAAPAPPTAAPAPGEPGRARSVSGEIRVPQRRAPSIRPPMPEPLEDDDSGPQISFEPTTEDPTGKRMLPVRRPAKPNPPELAERGGEIVAAPRPSREVIDEPRIIIADESTDDTPDPDVSGEFRITAVRDVPLPPATTIEVDDTAVGVVIHEHYAQPSEPVLLERRVSRPPESTDAEVIELSARKPRADRRTQMGIGALPALTRLDRDRDTDVSGVPAIIEDGVATTRVQEDPTRIDAPIAPGTGDTTDETLAPPPVPGEAATVEPGGLTGVLSGTISARPPTEDDDEELKGPHTSVMTAVELDEAMPERRLRSIDYDPVDDGWGPPGTTIPPPLLGAVPGSDDEVDSAGIPLADPESAPLIVAAPSPPSSGAAHDLVRELEEATARSIELIQRLEHATTRDEVIAQLVKHLADSHRRTGFLAIKGRDLSVFAMHPRPEVVPVTTLLLDRPSTLQDVVGTRLPYRGPMLDDASRNFFAALLGACPTELLLVPVAIRERVVGVLYGDHRLRHSFDDQLALAARAAGMALERILKAKR